MGESLEEVVVTLVKKLDRWSQININEAQTSQVIILRLLQALGWDIWDPEEVKAQDSSSKTYRPDFLLNVNGEPALVLEVKALDKTPTDEDRTQVVNYANSQNIRWAVLTTGRVWEFFDNKEEAKAPEKRVLLFQLDDPSPWKFLEGTLSRSFWEDPKYASEELGDRARTMQKQREEDKKLSQIKGKLNELLKEGSIYQRNEKALEAAIKNELSDDEKQFALKNFPRLIREVLGKEPPQPTKEKILETLRDFLFKDYSTDYPEGHSKKKTRSTPIEVEFNENALQDESEKWIVIDSINSWRDLYYRIIDCLFAIDGLYAEPEEGIGQKIINQVRGIKIHAEGQIEAKKMSFYSPPLSSSKKNLLLYYQLDAKDINKKLDGLLKGLKEAFQLQRPILRVRYKSDENDSTPLEVVY